MGEPFPFDDDKRRKFRNDVVHDGKWPAAQDALDYGKYVFETVVALAAWLENKYPGATQKAELSLIQTAHTKAFEKRDKNVESAGSTNGTSSVTTMIRPLGSQHAPGASFDDVFKEWSASNHWAFLRQWEATGVGPEVR